MDCGANDFVCRAVFWFRDAAIDLTQWNSLLRDSWLVLSDGLRELVELLLSHSEKIFGLAGFSFGVWRWWYTRERVLHKRLQEYLSEQDRRLQQARSYVVEAIYRPGPKQKFADPLFAVRPLRHLLRRRRWDSLFDFRRTETSADQNLDKALGDIERRVGIAVGALTSLRAQMASAYLLKGAIASARASQRRDGAQRIEFDDEALTHFRTVLQVHDYERDVQAKEFEAHQLRKLGHLTEAKTAYEQLEGLTAWIADERMRKLTLARARRHRGQIAQALAVGGSEVARALVVEAKELRSLFAPFRDWDGIEQGDTHYLEAYIRHRLGHGQVEQEQLSQAATAYSFVLSRTSSGWFVDSATKRLRATAQAGLSRVDAAKKAKLYDTACLLP